MTPEGIAQLVEFSEDRAYQSLIQTLPRPSSEEYGLRMVSIGSAVAIVARSITDTLNFNRVIGLGIAEPAAESTIDEIMELYRSNGVSFGIELGPFSRPDE